MRVIAVRERASAQLTTSVKNEGTGLTRVAAAGELDIATAADFGIELARVIDERGPDVLIDASALTFCDARGLAAIVAADTLARRRGGAVTLTGARPQIARLLRLTGLDKRFMRPARPPFPAGRTRSAFAR
ncbi:MULTISPECIES: STAS domain-containing protein [unclassified Spirillospora]|uniref:STAS domain-containing protein n=1 Tax=unclassified Spirillospora TaxID=2642701 RepID=UPI003724341F